MTGSTAGRGEPSKAAGPEGPTLQGEPLEHDAVLGAALRDATGDHTTTVDWTRLRGAINAGAAAELARRRRIRSARVFVVPATIAAGFALFVLVARAPELGLTESIHTSAAGQLSIEELLDADVSDRQFQALLSGADDANDLLLIAAEDQ